MAPYIDHHTPSSTFVPLTKQIVVVFLFFYLLQTPFRDSVPQFFLATARCRCSATASNLLVSHSPYTPLTLHPCARTATPQMARAFAEQPQRLAAPTSRVACQSQESAVVQSVSGSAPPLGAAASPGSAPAADHIVFDISIHRYDNNRESEREMRLQTQVLRPLFFTLGMMLSIKL